MTKTLSTDAGRTRRVPRSEITWPKGQVPLPELPSTSISRAEPMPLVSAPTRLLYLLALLAMVVSPAVSSWVMLATGGGALAAIGLATYLVLAVAVWRALQVWRDGQRLAAPRPIGVARWIRAIGLWLMAIGSVTVVLQFFVGPIANSLFGRPSGSGVEFFAVGLWLAVFSGWAPAGLLLFEFSRLLGFERQAPRSDD